MTDPQRTVKNDPMEPRAVVVAAPKPREPKTRPGLPATVVPSRNPTPIKR